MTTYAMSKAGAKAFGAGLAGEMKMQGNHGIKVSVICPAHIDTKLFKGFHVAGAATMSPEYVASRIIQAVECETELVMIPNQLLAFIPIIAMNEFFGSLHLPTGGAGSAMKKFSPEQANKIFDKMDSRL